MLLANESQISVLALHQGYSLEKAPPPKTRSVVVMGGKT